MADINKQALYLHDAYIKEFETEVLSVKDGKFIVLRETAFYPSSGGQPNDEGIIMKEDGEEFKVVFVGKFDGSISHEVDHEGIQPGDKVKGIIDWNRRYTLMRMHTAAHILSAIFHDDAGAMITGNQLGTDKSRIDFSLDEFDRDRIEAYANKANELIRQGRPIRMFFSSRDEVMKMPGAVKLAGALPPNIDTLRMLEIEGIDLQADGGTHVSNTKEIGEIRIVKAENKGKNNRRVYYELAE